MAAADVAVAESDEERSFLRSTNALRLEKMEDNFFPPRRSGSRSPPSDNSGTVDGEATAAVIAQRETRHKDERDQRTEGGKDDGDRRLRRCRSAGKRGGK